MKMKVFACLMALLMIVSSAYAWEAPCVEAPYDYSYEDETRSIAIRKVFADQSQCFVVDVQIQDVSGFHAALSKRCP